MRNSRIALFVGIVAIAEALAAAAIAQDQKAPGSGIFVEASGTQAEVKLPSTRLDVQESGVGKSMMTMGLTKPQTHGSIVGAKAETRVAGEATFRMQFGTQSADASQNMSPMAMMSMMNGGDGSMPQMAKSPQDVLLVKLNVANESREANFGSPGSNRPKDAVDLVIEPLGSSAYRVKPKRPLAPGEYAFYVRMGGSMPAGPAWAFGVDGK